MAERGGTEWEIMSYLGHSTPDEARTYIKNANRGRLGDNAMRKMDLSNLSIGLDKYSAN